MNVRIDPKITGAFILQLRQEHGLTQKQLAEKLGITDKAVSRWETGKGYPDIEMLVSIGELFSVSVNELLCGERTPTPAEETAEQEAINSYRNLTPHRRRKTRRPRIRTLVALLVFLVLNGVVYCSLRGSKDCVIARDYSSMMLFEERYVPVIIDNEYLRMLGDVLVPEAIVKGSPVLGKLFFGDSVYALRMIPNHNIVYLMTDHDGLDTYYYCKESLLEEYTERYNAVPLND